MNRLLFIAVAIAITIPVRAAISVIPGAPTAGVPVSVRVDNTYATIATLRSATISRMGNAFEIVQHVRYECPAVAPLPVRSAAASVFPAVVAQFQLGALPSGTYIARSTTHFEITAGTCSLSPFVQAKAFVVAEAIPLFDHAMLAALAVIFVLIGATHVFR